MHNQDLAEHQCDGSDCQCGDEDTGSQTDVDQPSSNLARYAAMPQPTNASAITTLRIQSGLMAGSLTGQIQQVEPRRRMMDPSNRYVFGTEPDLHRRMHARVPKVSAQSREVVP